MRILYLAHRIPDAPTKGDKIRSFHQIRTLASRHEVHLVALDDDPAGRIEAPAWQGQVASCTVVPLSRLRGRLRTLKALVQGSSLSAAHFAEPALLRAVRHLRQQGPFDVVVVYTGAMAPLAAGLRPLVVDLVDVDSAKFSSYHGQHIVRGLRRHVFGLEGKRLRRLEQQIVSEADLTLVCTSAEAELLRTFARPGHLEVVENGVDLQAFAFRGIEDRRPCELVFVGAMDYHPNVDAARRLVEQLLPRIRDRWPDASVTLVGRHPVADVLRLERHPGVTVVPDPVSVLPYLHRATLTLQPLRIARGIQNKALEALAAGVPLVMTTEAAVGLRGVWGRDYLVGRTTAQLLEATFQLLDSQERRAALARAGRLLVESEYQWPALLTRFEQLVLEAAGG